MPRYVAAPVADIPPGSRKIVDVAGRSIGIFNLDGEFFALRNRCPHQGGPLCEGRVWGALESTKPGEFNYSRGGEILACIWHGWEFDIRTGQSWCDPARLRVKSYDVGVEPGTRVKAPGSALPEGEAPGHPGGATRLRGPYIAETYPVTTEGDYVVVDIPT